MRPRRTGSDPRAALAAAVEQLAPAAGEHRRAAARTVILAQAHRLATGRGLPAADRALLPPIADAGRLAEPVLDVLPAPPSFAWLGAAWPSLLAKVARKQSGAWFTLPELAEPTVARTLAPLSIDHRPLRIVDPAAGSGAFLLAALRHRVAAGRRAADVAGTELFGLELDPTAALLAALALHEACGDDAPPLAAIAAHVRAGDGLLELDDGTFDAVLGNPPWETLQAARREPVTAGGSTTGDVARRVAELRRRFADQGNGKLYTYRLFVERALRLLRTGGRLGMIVPASLWFDRDAAPLRTRLLDECRWEWLFAFENRRRLFAIDGRYRFGPIVAEKGGRTDAVRAAFLRTEVGEWAATTPPHVLYPRELIRALSPTSGAFVEVRGERDLELQRRMIAASRPLLGRNGLCSWRQGDFNMTADRDRFRARGDCERDGHRPQIDGTWRRADGGAVLRALHQGAMIAVLHPNAGAYAGGERRAVRWRPPARPDALEPQFLVDGRQLAPRPAARVALRALTNATNERSAIACLLADEPCGNSLGVLTARPGAGPMLRTTAFAAGVLGSLCWDWLLRQRLGGTNVNGFVLADMVVPRASATACATIAAHALYLCAVLPWHESLWHAAATEGWGPPRRAVPLDEAARRELLVALELAVASAFGLVATDLEHILDGCDHPVERLRDRTFTRTLWQKGFWRIDRHRPPAERLPVQVLRAARAAASAPSPASAVEQ